MTVTQAGPEHAAGAHGAAAHGAGAHAVPPPVQMVQMLAGFQVSQALYAAAATPTPVSIITARA